MRIPIDIDLYRNLLIEFVDAQSTSYLEDYDKDTLSYYARRMTDDGLIRGDIRETASRKLRSFIQPTEKGTRLAELLKDEARWQRMRLRHPLPFLMDAETLTRELTIGDRPT